MKKEEMIEKLSEGACTVYFTKVNGDERVLVGTRNPDLIREDAQTAEGSNSTPEPENIVRVFDLEADGWRSFRVDSVTNFIG